MLLAAVGQPRDRATAPATPSQTGTAILRKLGLRDRVRAAVTAYEWGLIRPGT